MKILSRLLTAIFFIVLAFAAFVQVKFRGALEKKFDPPKFSISAEVQEGDLALGKRIYQVRSGCIECHGADHAGRAIMDNGAIGTISGNNLTPYKLSTWSDEEIARAIRYGIHRSGRSLRFMPSFDYEGMSKTDLASLIKYLRSVPSVQKENPTNTFGPIARVMSALGKMPIMFPALVVDPKIGFGEKPAEGPTKEFGKYLANDCKGCHGPEYRGGKIPGGDPAWPEAANIRLGSQKQWTEQSFIKMIQTGKSPTTGQDLRPPMPIHLLKQLNETEVKALWLYLGSLD